MSTIPLGPAPWPPHLTAAELDADLRRVLGVDAGPAPNDARTEGADHDHLRRHLGLAHDPAWYCPTCDDGHVGECTALTPPRAPLWRRLARWTR